MVHLPCPSRPHCGACRSRSGSSATVGHGRTSGSSSASESLGSDCHRSTIKKRNATRSKPARPRSAALRLPLPCQQSVSVIVTDIGHARSPRGTPRSPAWPSTSNRWRRPTLLRCRRSRNRHRAMAGEHTTDAALSNVDSPVIKGGGRPSLPSGNKPERGLLLRSEARAALTRLRHSGRFDACQRRCTP